MSKIKTSPMAVDAWPAWARRFVPELQSAFDRAAGLEAERKELATKKADLEQQLSTAPAPEDVLEAMATARLTGAAVAAVQKPNRGGISRWFGRRSPEEPAVDADALRAELGEVDGELRIIDRMISIHAAALDQLRADAPTLLRQRVEKDVRAKRAAVANAIALVNRDLRDLFRFTDALTSLGLDYETLTPDLGRPDDTNSPIGKTVKAFKKLGYSV